MAALAAVTNSYLIRRRHANAHGHGPLVTCASTAVRHITHHLCRVATALRTSAEREETNIYTHYEGWLPDDDDRPLHKWQTAWCPLVTDTQPRVRLHLRPPAPGTAPEPDFNPTDGPTVARYRAIRNRC